MHPACFAALQPYMEGKPGSAAVEFRMQCKDGSWLWTLGRGMVVERDADGKPLRMIGTNADISARKQGEEKIQLAASVFGHAREGITITDLQGTIVDVNDAFTRITGYSRDEVVGQNPRILNSGRQDKAFYDALWHEFAERRALERRDLEPAQKRRGVCRTADHQRRARCKGPNAALCCPLFRTSRRSRNTRTAWTTWRTSTR
jgi:PAS domain S-box-containing protein